MRLKLYCYLVLTLEFSNISCFRLQTNNELEKLRSDSKESYERENRGLREARELAVQEKNQVRS